MSKKNQLSSRVSARFAVPPIIFFALKMGFFLSTLPPTPAEELNELQKKSSAAVGGSSASSGVGEACVIRRPAFGAGFLIPVTDCLDENGLCSLDLSSEEGYVN
eukprot:Protomagalhaensia_sp_Gyna_25__1327@NODE_1667_length_1643_cov_15_634040_g1365_i0_p4_GENE_NODE_1667_length_1643_cov_15_634040_g1365_i0NODE_1667_length_1643_cov_15_634040_g1365_i0_p4_ORF_typecomplete_len104_score22_25DUF2062/PF09835_9/0_076_NODE_1667_length_1643_cov_15_634040_g1365_i0326637